MSSAFREELGHVIGSTGEVIHHLANFLTLTAQALLKTPEKVDAEQGDEKHPEGDVFTEVERDRHREPSEMHKDMRTPWWEEDQARKSVGFSLSDLGGHRG